MIEVVLHEGRKHVVRRLLDAVGHPVRRLVRTDIGPVALGELAPGRTRLLTADEIGRLYREVGL
jgi:23S rRNA pseudouridine2605 synthase